MSKHETLIKWWTNFWEKLPDDEDCPTRKRMSEVKNFIERIRNQT